MTWRRATFAQALAATLQAAADDYGEAPPPSVFALPPETLNAPALVVGRPAEVLYGTGGLGVDVATVPVICLAAMGGEDVVDALIAFVRGVLGDDPTVGGVAQIAYAPSERNWRAVRIGGADMLAADVSLTVQM
jgi:hypothetical protein